MILNMYEYIVPIEERASPTMGASAMGKYATENYGKQMDDVTIGDLEPKPPIEMADGWLASLKEEAKNPAHAHDVQYKIRQGTQVFKYSETKGLPSLAATVAECFTHDTGMGTEAKHVRVGTGAKGALKGALKMLKAGDVVIMAAPGWPTNFDMPPAGVKIIEVTTSDGLLRDDDINEVVKKYHNPRAVWINAPCNPTGANYKGNEREKFFAAINAGTKDTMVISDDPYGKLNFTQAPYDINTVLKRGPEETALFDNARLACFRTVSKEYGLAGERIGFLITKNEKMLDSLQKHNDNGGGVGTRNQLLAQAALHYGDEFIETTRKELLEKRKILSDGIAGLQWATMDQPDGTIYGWPNFEGLKGMTVPAAISETGEAYTIDTPDRMVKYLVNVVGVCGVPGEPFFAPGSPAAKNDWHVRVTFCCEREVLQSVIKKLTETEKLLTDPKGRVNGQESARQAMR